MKRLYALFLRLYPREYRDLFGPEVLGVFAQAADEHRQRGLAKWLLFLIAELSGALASAARHWADRFSRHEAPHAEIAGTTRPHLFTAVQEAQIRVDLNIRRMEHAIANHDFAGARAWSYEERKARAELERLRDLFGFGDDEELTPQ